MNAKLAIAAGVVPSYDSKSVKTGTVSVFLTAHCFMGGPPPAPAVPAPLVPAVAVPALPAVLVPATPARSRRALRAKPARRR